MKINELNINGGVMLNNESSAPIGVFDSGVGGLTVAREIIRQLQNEKIVYFGDTARVPYGSKSRETVLRYSRQIVKFLLTKNVKAIVVACNTASAFALEELQKEFDIPIIGVIKPGARCAVDSTKTKRIGVIGTEGTIRSAIYSEVIHNYDKEATVLGKPCPLFVPLVEEGWLHDTVTDEVASRYLSEFKDRDIDTLIMGCTHYPLLRSTIRKVMGDDVTLVNPAYETAQCLKKLLEKEGLSSKEDLIPKSDMYDFYVSDAPRKFVDFANSIMPIDVESATQINIEEY